MITVNDEKIGWYEGMTISDLLEDVHEAHLYWVVKLNNRYVSRPDFDKVEIPDQSNILLVPVISGG